MKSMVQSLLMCYIRVTRPPFFPGCVRGLKAKPAKILLSSLFILGLLKSDGSSALWMLAYSDCVNVLQVIIPK